MDNVINFPSWIMEKERELEELELRLKIKNHRLEIERKKIKNERIAYRTRILLSFCLGLLAMGSIVLLFL